MTQPPPTGSVRDVESATNSARPTLLRRYRQSTNESMDRLDDMIDTTKRAAAAYAARCSAYPVTFPVGVRPAVEQARALGTKTGQIGQAFGDADRFRELLANYSDYYGTGRGDDVTLDDLEKVIMRAAASPEASAAFLEALGPKGLIDAFATFADAQALQRHKGMDSDAVFSGLSEIFGQADEKVVLGLIQKLGRSQRGGDLLRHISIDAEGLSTKVRVAIAEETVGTDRWKKAPETWNGEAPEDGLRALLRKRMKTHGLGSSPDAAGLSLLASDGDAARRWNDADKNRPSRLERQLEWIDDQERDLVALVADAILTAPVLAGRAKGETAAFVGVDRPDGRRAREIRAFADRFMEVKGSRVVARVWQRLLEAHPVVTARIDARSRYRGEPSEEAVALRLPLAGDDKALNRAIDDVADQMTEGAARAAAMTSPTGRGDGDPNPFRILDELAPSRHAARALQKAAYQGGRRDNAILNGIRAAEAIASKVFLKHGLKFVPGGPALKTIVKTLVPCAEAELDKRVVHPNERHDLEVSAELGAVAAVVTAKELAKSEMWRKVMVEPEVLDRLDPAGSAEDAAAFAQWVQRQPDRLREPLIEAVTAGLPADFVTEQGCTLESVLPGGK